jgi:HEAT repeat protein
MRRRKDARGLARAAHYAEIVEGVQGEVMDLGTPIRREALMALAELTLPAPPDLEILEAIFAATRDSDEDVAMAAVDALFAASEHEAAQEALIRAAAASLTLAGHDRARSRALDGIPSFGPGAAGLLVREMLGREGDGGLTEQDRLDVLQILEATTGETVANVHSLNVLTEALSSPRRVVRTRVDQAFRWFGGEALDHLLAALHDPSTRPQAASALGAAGHVDAVPALCDALLDQAPEVRREAAHALGQIKTPRAVEALLRATDDGEYSVRVEAIEALDGLGTVGIVASIDSLARASRPLAPTSSPRAIAPAAEEKHEPLDTPPATINSEQPVGAGVAMEESRPEPLLPDPYERDAATSIDAAAANGSRILWPGLRRILEQRRAIERSSSASPEA